MRLTRAQFERECKRRFGTANPERMRIATWEWMVRRGGGPSPVRVELGLEPNYPSCTDDGCSPSNPDWCFARYGMSHTMMPDGRIIRIAGEHEDSYDPDFCIYNDVVVLKSGQGQTTVTADSGEVEIYGYPPDVFPPTDFHSATLVGDRIIIIGRLGYSGARRRGVTPVLALDTRTYRIDAVPTVGPCPGWIYKHHAWYDPARQAITVRGGKVEIGDPDKETTNYAAHRLHLADMRWEVISQRETHRRFVIRVAEDDGSWLDDPPARAFRPGTVAHEWLPPADQVIDTGVDTYSLSVDGVRVQFQTFCTEIPTLIEGDLPPDVADRLLKEIADNLGAATGVKWATTEIGEPE